MLQIKVWAQSRTVLHCFMFFHVYAYNINFWYFMGFSNLFSTKNSRIKDGEKSFSIFLAERISATRHFCTIIRIAYLAVYNLFLFEKAKKYLFRGNFCFNPSDFEIYHRVWLVAGLSVLYYKSLWSLLLSFWINQIQKYAQKGSARLTIFCLNTGMIFVLSHKFLRSFRNFGNKIGL